jgi:hypothetical protein
MPQLPISLSATIIGKLSEIAKAENEMSCNDEKQTKASTIAARIVRVFFEEVNE